MTCHFIALALLFPAVLPAQAGSYDVFVDALAGPYGLSIFVKSPRAVPGVAQVEIRSVSKDLRSIYLVPTLIAGGGRRFAPSPEAMKQSKEEPGLFTASLWMSAVGSWKVRVLADGIRGMGEVSVPVPVAARRTLTMGYALGALLALFGLALVLGAASIAGASIREGQLWPGISPTRAHASDARWYMLAAAAVAGGLLFGANYWWSMEAGRYQRQLYKPLSLNLDVDPDGQLFISMANAGWQQPDSDLVPDHGYFLRLCVVSLPSMDKVFHLHPDMQVAGVFTARLPSMLAGKYLFFGEIVHSNGLTQPPRWASFLQPARSFYRPTPWRADLPSFSPESLLRAGTRQNFTQSVSFPSVPP